MIFFLTTRFGRHTVDEYLAWKGAPAREFLKPVTYAQAARTWGKTDPPPGVYIFADLERLSPEAQQGAERLWERLQKDPERWLTVNRPGGTLRRLELLRRLHQAGINRHRAWPLSEAPPPDVRFPVFLRVADDHRGARTGLLRDRGELEGAAAALRRKGTDLSGWIGCEYAGTVRPDGLHAKYAAFRVEGDIYPRGILFAARWQVKYPERFGEGLLTEEWDYGRTNPHADTLRRVFELAGADFGRVDYGLDPEGRVSVWEINT
ncbi:MAG TPA: hypothetical protein VFR02_00270, partial [bacterium]|nr:hypothetical protein [bacterium]